MKTCLKGKLYKILCILYIISGTDLHEIKPAQLVELRDLTKTCHLTQPQIINIHIGGC